MNKLLLAVLLVSSFFVHAKAFAQLSDLPSVDDPTPVNRLPPPPPPPPMPHQPVASGSTVIPNITRQSQGDWYRLLLQKPTRLNRIDLRVRSARLKVYEVSLVTERSQRVHVGEFDSYDVLDIGMSASGYIQGDRIVAIDLRLESFDGYATAEVSVGSDDGNSYPIVLMLQQKDPVKPLPPPQDQYSKQDLRGYCPDDSHDQFRAAKAFAYSPEGLDYSDASATSWALDYNRMHACNTIREYSARYSLLYNVAYSPDGLDLASASAREFALGYVEKRTVPEIKDMTSTLQAARTFAYSPDGLDMNSAMAAQFARTWMENRCENARELQPLIQAFKKEYSFAYSPSGLDMSSGEAMSYAKNKIAPMSRCGRLLRSF